MNKESRRSNQTICGLCLNSIIGQDKTYDLCEQSVHQKCWTEKVKQKHFKCFECLEVVKKSTDLCLRNVHNVSDFSKFFWVCKNCCVGDKNEEECGICNQKSWYLTRVYLKGEVKIHLRCLLRGRKDRKVDCSWKNGLCKEKLEFTSVFRIKELKREDDWFCKKHYEKIIENRDWNTKESKNVKKWNKTWLPICQQKVTSCTNTGEGIYFVERSLNRSDVSKNVSCINCFNYLYLPKFETIRFLLLFWSSLFFY